MDRAYVESEKHKLHHQYRTNVLLARNTTDTSKMTFVDDWVYPFRFSTSVEGQDFWLDFHRRRVSECDV